MLAVNALCTSIVAAGLMLWPLTSYKIWFLLYAVCLFALEIGAAKLLMDLYPSLATALMLTCIMSPLLEEIVRSLGRTISDTGGFNVASISLSIGGVEAAIKAVRFYLVLNASIEHSPMLLAGVASASLTSILFHTNIGFFWTHLARTRRLYVVTFECFLVHAAYNATLAVVGAIGAGIAIYTNICVALLNAAALTGWLLYKKSISRARSPIGHVEP